jgi:hypothetical protein
MLLELLSDSITWCSKPYSTIHLSLLLWKGVRCQLIFIRYKWDIRNVIKCSNLEKCAFLKSCNPQESSAQAGNWHYYIQYYSQEHSLHSKKLLLKCSTIFLIVLISISMAAAQKESHFKGQEILQPILRVHMTDQCISF